MKKTTAKYDINFGRMVYLHGWPLDMVQQLDTIQRHLQKEKPISN